MNDQSNDDKPSDAALLGFYHEFSEENYNAGWIGEASEHESAFVEWLRARRQRAPRQLAPFERRALPVLRRAWALTVDPE